MSDLVKALLDAVISVKSAAIILLGLVCFYFLLGAQFEFYQVVESKVAGDYAWVLALLACISFSTLAISSVVTIYRKSVLYIEVDKQNKEESKRKEVKDKNLLDRLSDAYPSLTVLQKNLLLALTEASQPVPENIAYDLVLNGFIFRVAHATNGDVYKIKTSLVDDILRLSRQYIEEGIDAFDRNYPKCKFKDLIEYDGDGIPKLRLIQDFDDHGLLVYALEQNLLERKMNSYTHGFELAYMTQHYFYYKNQGAEP